MDELNIETQRRHVDSIMMILCLLNQYFLNQASLPLGDQSKMSKTGTLNEGAGNPITSPYN